MSAGPFTRCDALTTVLSSGAFMPLLSACSFRILFATGSFRP